MKLEYDIKLVSFFSMALIVARLIYTTGCHPRIALLISVFRYGWDDFFHFMLLFALLFGSCALLATLEFGSEFQEYGAFSNTLGTQYDEHVRSLIMVYVLCESAGTQ